MIHFLKRCIHVTNTSQVSCYSYEDPNYTSLVTSQIPLLFQCDFIWKSLMMLLCRAMDNPMDIIVFIVLWFWWIRYGVRYTGNYYRNRKCIAISHKC